MDSSAEQSIDRPKVRVAFLWQAAVEVLGPERNLPSSLVRSVIYGKQCTYVLYMLLESSIGSDSIVLFHRHMICRECKRTEDELCCQGGKCDTCLTHRSRVLLGEQLEDHALQLD